MPPQVVCCSAKVSPHNSEMERHPRICLVSQRECEQPSQGTKSDLSSPSEQVHSDITDQIQLIRYQSSDVATITRIPRTLASLLSLRPNILLFFFRWLHSLRTQAPRVDVQSFPNGIRVRKLPYFGSSIMAQSTVTGGGGTTPLDPFNYNI